MDKEEKIIKQTITKILKLLGVEDQFTFTIEEAGINIVLNTEEGGILIGYHGETLEALQIVFALAIARKLGRFTHVYLEIGDYKKNRTEWLTNLVAQTKEKVLLEKTDIQLANLKSWERKIIHLLLQDDPDVVSESVGEGRDRVLTIRPKN